MPENEVKWSIPRICELISLMASVAEVIGDIALVLKNQFNSIVVQGIYNCPNLCAILEPFLLDLLVHVNMDASTLAMFKTLYSESHCQHFSNDCCSLCITRTTTFK